MGEAIKGDFDSDPGWFWSYWQEAYLPNSQGSVREEEDIAER
jgi:hypothetical protein